MTELQKAFEDYACNERINLSALIRSAIRETQDANGEILILIQRWDALHPSTRVFVKSTGPSSWVQQTSHTYRNDGTNTDMPGVSAMIRDPQTLSRQLQSIIRANVCKIYVTSQRTRHVYHTSDLNLFK